MLLESTETPSVEDLWRVLSGDLLKFIQRRVSDRTAAEDLRQEVFVRVHTRLDELAETERVMSWVYTIARNLITDYYRSRAGSSAPTIAPLDDEGGDVENNQVVGAWLIQMVENLPETYREAVRMVELEGRPQKEVAARLGLSLSGAKSRVQRGRAQLRAMLGRCCHVAFDRRGNVVDYHSRSGCC